MSLEAAQPHALGIYGSK